MAVEALKGFLRIGLFIGVCGFAMIFIQPRESAEFVLSVCSAMMGGALVLGCVLLLRVLRPQE